MSLCKKINRFSFARCSVEQKFELFYLNFILKHNWILDTGVDTYTVDFTATTGKNNRWMTNLGGGAVLYPDRAEEDKTLLTYTSEELKDHSDRQSRRLSDLLL